MIPFKRIDHILITIPEGKTNEARAFYAGMLNLKEILGDHPKGAIWFKIGDVQLHIREEAGGNYSDRHPAFEVSDLAVAEQFLKSKKITISYSSEIDGRDRCFFRDPFGNRFELLEYK
ncbi:MAG: phage portal protein [Mucilaginibacter sp.]|nr:phage portal protein [Mucilaginibacter sp.]